MVIPIASESTQTGTDNNNERQRRNKPLCADFDRLSYFPFQVPLFIEGHPITDNVDTQKRALLLEQHCRTVYGDHL